MVGFSGKSNSGVYSRRLVATAEASSRCTKTFARFAVLPETMGSSDNVPRLRKCFLTPSGERNSAGWTWGDPRFWSRVRGHAPRAAQP